jgi:hypothetical protein
MPQHRPAYDSAMAKLVDADEMMRRSLHDAEQFQRLQMRLKALYEQTV